MTQRCEILSTEEVLRRYSQKFLSAHKSYKALFSSWLGGIVRDPALMLVPLDDHLVHRGDGVFEAVRFVSGGVYRLNDHLQRLALSAQAIGLPLPMSASDLADVVVEVVKASELSEGALRIFISRGPGGFSPSPYESVGSQAYVIATDITPPSVETRTNGVSVGLTSIPVKPGVFARAKTCNYLPNVLMKKEAVDRGLDYVISRDELGFIAESATESVAFIEAAKEPGRFRLVLPPYDRILRGCTLARTVSLAEQNGWSIGQQPFTEEFVKGALGAVILASTIDIVPVREFHLTTSGIDPLKIVYDRNRFTEPVKQLLQWLKHDMQESESLTPTRRQ